MASPAWQLWQLSLVDPRAELRCPSTLSAGRRPLGRRCPVSTHQRKCHSAPGHFADPRRWRRRQCHTSCVRSGRCSLHSSAATQAKNNQPHHEPGAKAVLRSHAGLIPRGGRSLSNLFEANANARTELRIPRAQHGAVRDTRAARLDFHVLLMDEAQEASIQP